MGKMDEVFESVDIILGENFSQGMLQISNFTGYPQLTLPCAHDVRPIRKAFEEENVSDDETANLPYSVGFWSRLFEEDKIIALGHKVEQALDGQPTRPPMDFG